MPWIHEHGAQRVHDRAKAKVSKDASEQDLAYSHTYRAFVESLGQEDNLEVVRDVTD